MVARLNAAVNEGLRDAAVGAALDRLGATAMSGSAPDFARFVATETVRHAEIISLAGIGPS